jgi:hypothetical protein
MGPSRSLASDLPPVLQCGSRPSSAFLAKILGVYTLQFVFNAQFYFTGFSLLLHKFCIQHLLSSYTIAQWVVCLPMVRLTHLWFTKYSFSFSFIHNVCNGCGDCLCICLFSFLFCWHSRRGGAQLVSQRETLKVHWYFARVKLYIFSVVWNTSVYGSRLAGFWVVLVNAIKTHLWHHEHVTNACLLHSHFSVFT